MWDILAHFIAHHFLTCAHPVAVLPLALTSAAAPLLPRMMGTEVPPRELSLAHRAGPQASPAVPAVSVQRHHFCRERPIGRQGLFGLSTQSPAAVGSIRQPSSRTRRQGTDLRSRSPSDQRRTFAHGQLHARRELLHAVLFAVRCRFLQTDFAETVRQPLRPLDGDGPTRKLRKGSRMVAFDPGVPSEHEPFHHSAARP
jgi:hypothetical protein